MAQRPYFKAFITEAVSDSILRYEVVYSWWRGSLDWEQGRVDTLTFAAATALAQNMQQAFVNGCPMSGSGMGKRQIIGLPFVVEHFGHAGIRIGKGMGGKLQSLLSRKKSNSGSQLTPKAPQTAVSDEK